MESISTGYYGRDRLSLQVTSLGMISLIMISCMPKKYCDQFNRMRSYGKCNPTSLHT